MSRLRGGQDLFGRLREDPGPNAASTSLADGFKQRRTLLRPGDGEVEWEHDARLTTLFEAIIAEKAAKERAMEKAATAAAEAVAAKIAAEEAIVAKIKAEREAAHARAAEAVANERHTPLPFESWRGE